MTKSERKDLEELKEVLDKAFDAVAMRYDEGGVLIAHRMLKALVEKKS